LLLPWPENIVIWTEWVQQINKCEWVQQINEWSNSIINKIDTINGIGVIMWCGYRQVIWIQSSGMNKNQCMCVGMRMEEHKWNEFKCLYGLSDYISSIHASHNHYHKYSLIARACLDSWKWEGNAKWKNSFPTSLVCFEPEMKNPLFLFRFLVYASFLHYHFFTFRCYSNFVVM